MIRVQKGYKWSYTGGFGWTQGEHIKAFDNIQVMLESSGNEYTYMLEASPTA